MKRASIRVFLDKNLETFLRDATFTTFLLLSLELDCPTNCLLCGAYGAKVGSTRAKLWRPGILIRSVFFFLGVNFVLKLKWR
jgi:hypothetical protein